MGVLRRKSPLFRRKSSKNVSVIEAEVDYVIQSSPFLLAAQHEALLQAQACSDADAASVLQDTPSPSCTSTTCASCTEPIAKFSRKEIQLGKLLGMGSFSQVHEITSFKLTSPGSISTSSSHGKRGKQPQCTFNSPQPTMDPNQRARVAVSQSAFDTTGNAKYAVKFVRKELAKKPHSFRLAAADMILEAMYLAALDHPNIIKLRGVARLGVSGFMAGHDGYFFMVDRLEESLEDRIQRWKQQTGRSHEQAIHGIDHKTTSTLRSGSNSTATAVRTPTTSELQLLSLKANYALQIASALAYLHDRKVVFRDLKPSNVGFRWSETKNGVDPQDSHQVQLFDFGLCRELPVFEEDDGLIKSGSKATTGTTSEQDDTSAMFHMSGAGTYMYMSPEIFTRDHCYNCKADVYSWAIVLHEMISLERPFHEYSIEEYKEFVCEIGQRPPDSAEAPPALNDLIRLAWEQDPTERLTMHQVCQQLTPIVDELQLQVELVVASEDNRYESCMQLFSCR